MFTDERHHGVDGKTNNEQGATLVKWLPWFVQIAVLIWGASQITSQVSSLAEYNRQLKVEVQSLQISVTSLQIRVAELSVELALIRKDRL